MCSYQRCLVCVMLIGLTVMPNVLAQPTWAQDADLEARLEALQRRKKDKVLKIVKDNQDALIQVKIASKSSMSVGSFQAPEQEQTLTTDGTIIDPSGLCVVSHTQTDPMGLVGKMMGSMNVPGAAGKVKTNAKITDVKIVLNDGTELPAKIVLKDEDLDLSFVMPTRKGLDLPHVELDPSIEPDLLDSAVCVKRMGVSNGRATVIQQGTVSAVIEKPRTLRVVSSASVGCPAFDREGRCFGIALMVMSFDEISFSSMMSMSNASAMTPTVVPAAEILSVAEQIQR